MQLQHSHSFQVREIWATVPRQTLQFLQMLESAVLQEVGRRCTRRVKAASQFAVKESG